MVSSFSIAAFSARVVFTSSTVRMIRVSSSVNRSTAEGVILLPQLCAETLFQYVENFAIKAFHFRIGQRAFWRLIYHRQRKAVLCVRELSDFHPIEWLNPRQFGYADIGNHPSHDGILGPFVEKKGKIAPYRREPWNCLQRVF